MRRARIFPCLSLCLALSVATGAEEAAAAAEQQALAAGAALLEQGELEGALSAFQSIVEAQPDQAVAQGAIAYALDKLERLDEALVAYERALELAPEDATLHNNLGVALQRAGQYDRAVATLERAAALAPGDAATLENLETARRNQQIDRRERKELDEAIQAADEGAADPKAAYRLARIYAHRGNSDDAVKWLEASVERGLRDLRLLSDDPVFAKLLEDPRIAALVGGK